MAGGPLLMILGASPESLGGVGGGVRGSLGEKGDVGRVRFDGLKGAEVSVRVWTIVKI